MHWAPHNTPVITEQGKHCAACLVSDYTAADGTTSMLTYATIKRLMSLGKIGSTE